MNNYNKFLFQKYNYKVLHVQNKNDINQMISDSLFSKINFFAYDTETTGLNIMKDKPFLVIFGFAKCIYLWDANYKEATYTMFDIVKRNNKMLFAHNAKFDYHMLKNINKNLSIYCKDRHDIKELYCKGIEYEDLNNLSKYDIIINTVDFNLIKGSMFSDLKYQVKLYDIASYPYGFSLDDASNYHFKVEILPKLPSLVPKEAGQVLYLTIKKMI